MSVDLSTPPDQLTVELVTATVTDEIKILAAQVRRLGHTVMIRRPRRITAALVRHVFGWDALAAAYRPNGPALLATVAAPDDDASIDIVVDIARICQRLIVTSSQDKQLLVSSGLHADAVTVMPGMVDTRFYRPDGSGRPLRGLPRAARLLCVRQTLEPNGVLDALVALRRIPDALLFITGGPPAAELRADPAARAIAGIARRVRVSDRVVLLGGVSEAAYPNLYRSADAVVCTGEPDAAGTALKAMACGTPVAAYAQGGVPDVVTSGHCGLLVQAGNATELGDMVAQLLAAQPRRSAMTAAGLSRVAGRFSHYQVAKQLVALYATALADHLARGPVSQPVRNAGGAR